MPMHKAIGWTGVLLLGILSCGGRSPDELVADLESPDGEVRQRAAYELLTLRKEKVVPLLIEVTRTGSDQAKYIAAQLLGKMDDSRAMEPLVALLDAENEYIRAKAVESLGNLGGTEVVDPLLRSMEDPQPVVREKAAEALRGLDDPRIVPTLIHAFEDPIAGVRRNALVSLATFWPTLQDTARRDSVRLKIEEAAEDASANVRFVAVQLLGRMHDTHAVPVLIQRLRDSSSSVRQKAARSLGEIGNKEAVRPLEILLRTGRKAEQIAAKEALKKLTGYDYAIQESEVP